MLFKVFYIREGRYYCIIYMKLVILLCVCLPRFFFLILFFVARFVEMTHPDGSFKLELFLPSDYPMAPPKVSLGGMKPSAGRFSA